ncbi:MAG TPA: Wzz/FepE/Etk N-terminal domain-containing protein [Stenomitos sp.]
MREFEPMAPSFHAAGEVDLQQVVRLFWRRRWVVLVATSLGLAASWGLSITQRASYTASTSIMAVENGGTPGLPSEGGLAGLLAPASREASVTDKLVALLRSRTIVAGAIRDNRLLPALLPDRPRGWTEEQALFAAQERLVGMTKIETDPKAGTILIKVTYSEPGTAAAVANGYVRELETFLKDNSLSSAQRKRTFLEQKVQGTAKEVDTLEQQQIAFQEQKNLISLDTQTRAIVESYVGLKSKLMAKQAELSLQERSLSRNDIQLIGLRGEIDQLKESITRLEQSGDGGFVALKELPKLTAESLKLQRTLATKQKLLDMLSEQLELAKVQEAYESLSFQVVDPAIAPMQPNKSSRSVAILLGSFFGLFLGALIALGAERFGRSVATLGPSSSETLPLSRL